MLFPQKIEFYPEVPKDRGCRPYETTAEVEALKHRVSMLERRVDGLVALLTNPKDPNGSSGAPAAPAAVAIAPPEDKPVDDFDLVLLIAQRQHHQQSAFYRN